MGTKIIRFGEKHDARFGLFLLSYDERLAVVRSLDRSAVIAKRTLPNDNRSIAVACEVHLSGVSAKDLAQVVCERAEEGWTDTLDNDRISVRFIYERMHEGKVSRDVPGFIAPHIDLIEREMTAGSTALETACALWRLQRRVAQQTCHDSLLKKHMPALHLIQSRLPEGVRLSNLASPLRQYEPVFIVKGRAYPVSAAWVMLPSADVLGYAQEISAWMAEKWPEGLEVCDEVLLRSSGSPLDRRNMQLAAEAFARGYLVEEAAEFIFEQRIREEESVA